MPPRRNFKQSAFRWELDWPLPLISIIIIAALAFA